MKLCVKMQKSFNFFMSLAKKNKKVSIVMCLLFIFIVGISVTIFSSLARVGFNMNVVYQQNIPEEPWFTKLVEGKVYQELDYEVWSGNVAESFTSGTGTREDPFIISNGEEFAYLAKISEKQVMLDKDTNQVCSNNSLTNDATTDAESWGGTKHIVITNKSNATLTTLNVSFSTGNDTIARVYVDDNIDIPWTQDTTEQIAVASGTVYLPPGESFTLNIDYISPSSEMSDFRYTLLDADNIEYYMEDQCVLTNMTNNKFYKVVNNIDFNNIDFTGIGNINAPFEGTIDAGYYHFKNLSIVDKNDNNVHHVGLFNYVNNAIVKNFIFENSVVNINGSGLNYAGTIVGYASGSSKIYNNGILSGKLNVLRNTSAEMYAGGLVGYITDTTVVANSYSYADIVSKGNNNTNLTLGGLVGYRNGTSNAIDEENPIVYLLVMYGSVDISSAKSYQYVYNGTRIDASLTPTYCYYLWLGDTVDTNSGINNTYAILKSYDDIVADGFKAHLNSYRYMVNYYVGNDSSINASDTNGYSDIASWYTKNSESLYPIIKKYSKSISDSNITSSSSVAASNFGSNYVKVNLINDTKNETKTYYLAITDKNEDLNDYTNRKITLPYNSVTSQFIYGNNGELNGYDMTLTGWQLTSVIQDGTTYNTQIDGSKINYNYTLRSGTGSASKDINTVYAQGGFYLVPDGVTEITLKARWGYTIYAKDQYNDMVYLPTYQNGDSTIYGETNAKNSNNGLTPETPVASLGEAYNKVANISSSNRSTFYDVVIMLVGNLHYSPSQTVGAGSDVTHSTWAYTGNDRPVTIMSYDYDKDLEPDFALYTRNVHDQDWPSLRFDFVSVLSIPQVGTINAKLNAMTLMNDASFEVTETAKTDRIDLRHYQAKYVKLNAGYYDVYNLWPPEARDLKKNYIYFGGYAKAIYFTAGVESRGLPSNTSNKLPVFVVTGGRIDTLAATYFGTVVAASNDVYFYLDGGYVNKFYTTYNSSLNKKAIVNINDSYVNTYYAGGHTESAYVYGGVTTTVNNSRIGELYGGPEYGTIENGSTLNINNSEIDVLYGSGYGGTQTTEINLVFQDSGSSVCSNNNYYYNITNNCSLNNSTNGADRNKSYCFGRTSSTYGIETGFYATTYTKSGCTSKAFATYYSSLSAANVDRVFINIKDSTINKDFYGGGNKGIVDNSIVVNMENTTVNGDLYGGGLSNATETLEVFENTDGYEAPKFVSYTVDIEATYPQKYTYTWSGDKNKFSNGSSINTTEKLIYSENEGKLGNVNGEIYLNIKDSTIKGSVYGGGNLSEVNGDININISGNNLISGSIYGGGNKANVTGSTDLRISNLTIESVYGGGNVGNVIGDTSVTIMNGSNISSVYGGGNEASATTTNVYVENGKVENVYGGSNSSGEVDISNVNSGIFNPDDAKDGSDITIEEDSSSGSTEDTCQDRDIRYTASIANSNRLNVTLTNETDVTFNEYTVKIKVTNATGVGNNWSGTTARYSDGYIVLTHVGQWWGTNTISANASRTLSNNNLYLSGSGTMVIESVEIEALGSDGVTYYSSTCHDVIEEPEEDEGPTGEEVERTIDATVNNIFGGNNLGGKTSTSNINVEKSKVINIYGGGNIAPTDYTNVNVLEGAEISDSVYGGGNYGIVNQDTSVVIKNAKVHGSAYAGGNGTGATVLSNTDIKVSGSSFIDGSLFGGGNAAETGAQSSNNSIATTILSGGTINGSVYGGANTSKIWGTVNLIIGETEEEVDYSNINIGGTVFGGGEANASGSVNYDYSYISVTTGIDININVVDGYDINIGQSIFGSGNASSTSGYSNIYINNFGTRDIPKKIVSIQRAGTVELINSSVDISGTTDRTNEFSSIIYALSRIDDLVLANNSTLYLQSGANVVKELSSYLIDGNNRTLSAVNITDTKVTSNVDNRVYMFINKAFNIIDSENLQNGTFGNVNGMMFLGLYEHDRDLLPDTGIYNTKYQDGDIATNDDIFKFMSGSYVMGLHMPEHDITKNGFYTNYMDGENINVNYIDPTPEDAVYYQWIVGEASTTYTLSLTASKFATMGTDELSLLGFEDANTYFELVSYNDNNLASGVSLLDPDSIPRVSSTDKDALTNFGLKMTSGNVGWITDGETSYISTEDESNINGTLKYETSNSNDIPSFHFYFIHSKNITEDVKLGTVVIGLLGHVPIDEVTYEVRRIFIEVTLDTKYFETDNYESSMTPGKEYELFVNSKTDITASSSLSAYFSLYVKSNKNIYKEGFHRVLTSTYKLPINTRITMIDRTVEEKPVYYYYVVTEEDYNNVTSQISSNASGNQQEFFIYPLSKFVSMGSTSTVNNYSDIEANSLYYNSELGIAEEEFIFIVDYDKATINNDILNAEILLELKDEDEYTHYDSLGVSHANMVYNIYAEEESYIDIDLTQDRDTAYAGYDFNIKALMNFIEPTDGLLTIKDTNYTQDKMGLKISMYDSNGTKVNGTSLLGTLFYINGESYSARLDGSVRVKIADFVTNVETNIRIDLSKSMLATDTYTIIVESFGSPDGLYYGLTSAGSSEITIDIVNENYGLEVNTKDENIIIDAKTGTNTLDSNEITYNVKYTTQFSNPSIRVKLMRRNYSDIYSKSYELVDLNDYVSNLDEINDHEYLVTYSVSNEINYTLKLNDNLKTGTYKVVFMLYNNDTYIDEVSSYMIIK